MSTLPLVCVPEVTIICFNLFGTYEFGVLPRSIFAFDGSLLLAYDKASILHHLEKLTSDAQEVDVDSNETNRSEPSDN